MNKLQATEEMVKGFNAIKPSLIEKAYPYGEGFNEITVNSISVRGYAVYTGNKYDLYYYDELLEVIDVDTKNNNVTLKLTETDDIEAYGETITVDRIDCEGENTYKDGWLPMWSWLWCVDSSTARWICENLELTSDLGFRIYEDEDGDIFIGIDGAGYDFYGAHWIPLYEAMGLQWHNID